MSKDTLPNFDGASEPPSTTASPATRGVIAIVVIRHPPAAATGAAPAGIAFRDGLAVIIYRRRLRLRELRSGARATTERAENGEIPISFRRLAYRDDAELDIRRPPPVKTAKNRTRAAAAAAASATTERPTDRRGGENRRRVISANRERRPKARGPKFDAPSGRARVSGRTGLGWLGRHGSFHSPGAHPVPRAEKAAEGLARSTPPRSVLLRRAPSDANRASPNCPVSPPPSMCVGPRCRGRFAQLR